jgi:ABC-type dipeptide/oligopeptide/nickel transport system permease component
LYDEYIAGDPYARPAQACFKEFKASLRAVYGLNRARLRTLLQMVKSFAQGNLGYSFSTQSTVYEAVAKSFGDPAGGFFALIFEMLIGIFGGVVSADNQADGKTASFRFWRSCPLYTAF